MKGKLLTLFLLLLAVLLFPYMIAIAFINMDMDTVLLENGREVILEDESRIPAESYLVGILARQVDPSVDQEAIKAQAVLARTWLYQSMGSKKYVREEALSLQGMSLSQMKTVWKEDTSLYYEKLYAAVEETVGQCLYYGEEPVLPLYHKISAGQTRDDRTGSCPYLVSADCFYDVEAEGYQTVKLFSREELLQAVNTIDEDRQLTGIQINASDFELIQDSAGYVLSAAAGGFEFTGEELQEALSMPSSWFRLEDYSDGIRVLGKGIGHGYGMSQYGAARYAAEGRDYIWILQYYFHDISIKTV